MKHTPFQIYRIAQGWSRRHRGIRRVLAFTLVEMLLVIAVISILAAMVISSFSDAAQTSREVVVEQQLAVFQSALNSWANGKLGKIDTSIDSEGAPITLERLRQYYNGLNTTQRFVALSGQDLDDSTPDFEGYLEPMTAAHYIDVAKQLGAADMSKIKSDAMVQTGHYLTLPDWLAGGYPTVELHP